MQQGDPLGPLLFAIGLHPLIQQVQADGVIHRWYLDDGVMLAPTPTLEAAMACITQSFPSAGLQINLRKTTLWGPSASPEAQAALPADSFLRRVSIKSSRDVLCVLGVPVVALGNETALKTHITTVAHEMAAQMQLVSMLPDKQVAHSILRVCLGPVKASYLLRTVPYVHTKGMVAVLEAAQRASWATVVGGNLSPQAWIQSTMPISQGGCGLHLASNVGLSGRVSSILAFLTNGPATLGADAALGDRLRSEIPLVNAIRNATSQVFEPVKTWLEADQITIPIDSTTHRQGWWTARLHDKL